MKVETYETVSPLGAYRPMMTGHGNSIGAILVTQGKLSVENVDQVMALQHREGWRFGEAAMRLSLIDHADLLDALHKQYDLPMRSAGANMSSELVAVHSPDHGCNEELRALRTRLLLRWRQAGATRRVLAVISPCGGEGRSYVAANLAVLFSQLGERTLLIDGDFRRPRQHRIFGLPDRVGLSAVLSGRADRHVVQAIPGFHHLAVLPAGAPPPKPLELLSRPALVDLLDAYAAEFDVILIDTAPANLFSDAQVVAYHAGSALVVTRLGHTRLAETHRVVKHLGDGGVAILGALLNAC
ncbi:hypothetical protein B9N43_07330 [Denitratisoma sp. DHT3]|uniref:polysaccharide biosynthesis tyrosine autokinase n=1 Tax=Denitratisoma sp. DHT3 TaxID=1981880 RepID=UPI0011985E69|nr:polysaccharide biosynthesis tyrosine autokinase [Denitratisoma sp. DHT3]QDX81071.1 hypothetical protein B9N43_07330 [Denitratisoma sp. DHT3]